MTININKVEIIEFSFHTVAVANLIFALRGSADSAVHIRWRTRQEPDDEIAFSTFGFRPFVSNAMVSKSIASVRFYLGIIFRAPRARHLWISTGPESTVLADLLFFWIILRLWPEKVILSVRNVERWSVNGEQGSFQDRLRSSLIGKISRVYFESSSQMVEFSSRAGGRKAGLGWLPVYFADGDQIWPSLSKDLFEKTLRQEGFRLGILGGVDPSRRDYEALCAAISDLPKPLKKNLTLVLLGTTRSRGSEEVLKQLEKVSTVERENSFLSTRRMIDLAKSCDLLIAPLRLDCGYGNLKGTGAVGDAIMSGRKVLLPSQVQVGELLEELTAPYDSASDLRKKLADYLKRSHPVGWSPSAAQQLSSETSLQRLQGQLSIF